MRQYNEVEDDSFIGLMGKRSSGEKRMNYFTESERVSERRGFRSSRYSCQRQYYSRMHRFV